MTTTEQEINTALDEIIDMMKAGQALEAFEKFYHQNLEKTDLDGVTYHGKEINREKGIELLSKVVAVRDFTAVGKVVKENRSFLIWSLNFDHADNGAVKVIEVAIQDWQDGKIIRERYIA